MLLAESCAEIHLLGTIWRSENKVRIGGDMLELGLQPYALVGSSFSRLRHVERDKVDVPHLRGVVEAAFQQREIGVVVGDSRVAITSYFVVASRGEEIKMFVTPYGSFLLILHPVTIITTLEGRVAGEKNGERSFVGNPFDEELPDPGVGVGNVGGIGEADVAIGDQLHGRTRNDARNNDRGPDGWRGLRYRRQA